jgi:hypothetical protein
MITIALIAAMNQRPTIASEFRAHQFGADVEEARAIRRLAHERLDQRDPRDRERLLRDRFDLVALFARLLADVVHPAADGRERHDHQRNDRERHQREAPIEHEDRHDVVTIVAMLVTIETSVPVTTLSMLSTSLETRFMISPVFVPVKNESGMLVQMRDELRADVAHDPLAHERVEVAL